VRLLWVISSIYATVGFVALVDDVVGKR